MALDDTYGWDWDERDREGGDSGNRGTDAPTFSNPGTFYTEGSGASSPSASGGGDDSIDSYLQQIENESRRLGVPLTENYRADLERHAGYSTPDTGAAFQSIMGQLQKRAAPTSSRTVDSQSAAGNALYGSGSGNTTNRPGGPTTGVAPSFASAMPSWFQMPTGGADGGGPAFNGMFDDPASKLLEKYAMDRFAELQSPSANSGTALFEQWLRQQVTDSNQPSGYEQELPNIINDLKNPGRLEQYLPTLIAALQNPSALEQYLPVLAAELKNPSALEHHLTAVAQMLQDSPSDYEQYIPELVAQLKAPVYSDQQSSQLKAKVYDEIEVNRQQTKNRWIEEVGRRGFAPSSGPALEGLLQIDNQFNTMRTVADREFAVNAIDKTEQRRFQVADALQGLSSAQQGRRGEVTSALSGADAARTARTGQLTNSLATLGNAEQGRLAQLTGAMGAGDAATRTRTMDLLASTKALSDAQTARGDRRTDALGALSGSENNRLDKAMTYATIPKQLSDNAFQQNLQLVGAGGNPQSMLNSALSIYQTVANNNNMDSQEQQASMEAIFEYLAGLGA